MRRREFIAGIGGAVAWPLAARAQQPSDRVLHVGILLPNSEGEPEAGGGPTINGPTALVG